MVGTFNIFKSISKSIRDNSYSIQYRNEINTKNNSCIFVQNIITDGSKPVHFGIVVRGIENKGNSSSKMMEEILSWNNKLFKVKTKDTHENDVYLEVSTLIDNVNDAGVDDQQRSVLTCDGHFIIYFRKDGWK